MSGTQLCDNTVNGMSSRMESILYLLYKSNIITYGWTTRNEWQNGEMSDDFIPSHASGMGG